MIECFARAAPSLPKDFTLHLVGDGEERPAAEALSRQLGIDGRVVFHGEVNDPELLRPIFHSVRALIATGYIGLNAIQALGFGVPVIYPYDEPHAPEVVLLNDLNSRAYSSKEALSELPAILVDLASSSPSEKFGAPAELSARIADEHSTEQMASPFRELAAGASEIVANNAITTPGVDR
ncbi:hypothetical protein GCM10023199_34360 [Actinomycetospora chibensis]